MSAHLASFLQQALADSSPALPLSPPSSSSSSLWPSPSFSLSSLEAGGGTGSRGRSVFQWGASISALLLLVLNQTGPRSSLTASFLVLSLVISFPSVLFQILREEFGYWVAFSAVVAHLSFPRTIPVSRFLLFLLVPDWLAYELRKTIAGGVFCLLFTILILVMEIHRGGERGRGTGSCQCSLHCAGYWFSMLLLVFFIVLYLCLGPW